MSSWRPTPKSRGCGTTRRNEPVYSQRVELDLSTVEPSLAGPGPAAGPGTSAPFEGGVPRVPRRKSWGKKPARLAAPRPGGRRAGRGFDLGHGDVVIAAITSCTNTSNPDVMIAAGLVAKHAVEHGLSVKPWVKTSLAPGSKVVMDYYERAGLTPYLDKLGFELVGYGCTTCIGNSGPLLPGVSDAVAKGGLAVAAVLSGNRNFEGRINPDVRMNYLASPPLVVAYAIAGSMDFDITGEPLGTGTDGRPVYLRDIWPSSEEVAAVISEAIAADMFEKSYAEVFAGDERWAALDVPAGRRYEWGTASTYVRQPPYFDGMPRRAGAASRHPRCPSARQARRFRDDGPHLARREHQERRPGRLLARRARCGPCRFQLLRVAARQPRGHDAGHLRQCPARNQLAPGTEGGFTTFFPTGERDHDLRRSHALRRAGTPLVVLAGKEYGSGSSRDWAAKGTTLLGVRAVLAESFERIHRSNLIGMGVLPLQYLPGESAESLGLSGEEVFDITGLEAAAPLARSASRQLTVTAGGKAFDVVLRLDTPVEAEYYRHGGILPYVLRQLRRRPPATG